MRHGFTMRAIAVAIVGLIAGVAHAGGGKKDCDTCAPAVVKGVGTAAGCDSCSATTKKSLLNKLSPTACCDANFIFGSSKGFFAPCNPGCSDLPISVFHGSLRKNCPTPVYGTGIGQPANSCNGVYSHLFR